MFYSMKLQELPPVDLLRHYFRIDKHGRLERRTNAYGWRLAAKIQKGAKYFTLGFEGKQYFAHRIIWALHHGRPPEGLVDHINGQPWDNRPENLREVNHAQNAWNKAPKPNATGHANVLSTAKGFVAEVIADYKKHRSPPFADAELAGLAASEMRRRYHGEYARRAA